MPYRRRLPGPLSLLVTASLLASCGDTPAAPDAIPDPVGPADPVEAACPGSPVLRVQGPDELRAALAEAPAGAALLLEPGLYPPILVERDEVALCGDGGRVRIRPDSSYGVRITGRDVHVEGVEVRGVAREVLGVDHGPSGIVVAGREVTVRDVRVSQNRMNGVLVTDRAAMVLLEDVVAWDNTWAGIAVGGGSDITIRRAELYNTGSEDAPEGARQRYGIATDNVGDTRWVGETLTDVDGSGRVDRLSIQDSEIRGHLGYGIRVSVGNPAESALESGRITTRDLEILDSHIHANGIALDDWVGGLYHHGNVLIQHVEGGRVEGNLIEEGYTWGLDAYACNGIVYRDNLIVNNDRGLRTPGVTIAPTGVEINGGRDNVFAHNLVYGNGGGVFSSWIPDSGDGFDRAADAWDGWNGTWSLALEDNIIVGNRAGFTEPGSEPEWLVDYMEIGPESFTRTFTGNVLGTIPDWHAGGRPPALTPTFAADNPHWDLSPEEIFVDAPGGDFRIRDDSPLVGTGVGPASLRQDTQPASAQTRALPEARAFPEARPSVQRPASAGMRRSSQTM
jgi:hypothetical protein